MKSLALVLFFDIAIPAQVSTGWLYGRLTDQSGGAIADASVTETEEATGFSWRIQSDDSGQYRFDELPPGLYSIEIERLGFQPFTEKHARLEVTQQLREDVELRVGKASESVEVVAKDSLLQADDSTAGGRFPMLPSDENLRAQQIVLGHTATRPNAVNDIRVSFTRLRLFDAPKTAFKDNVAADFGLLNPPTAAFADPKPFHFGNAGRDIIPGPGNEVVNLALGRKFSIIERLSVKLRAEVFNSFHPNFGIPGPYPDFGPLFGKILASGDLRRIQFSGRFDFSK
jgi:hypothetical protein